MQEQVAEHRPNVVEVTDDDFMRTVVEESTRRPVVVDLWASWCQPCRIIGPILEKVAAERGGSFLLAKLDVDANPVTASQFRVQSIPTVIAFKDGQAVDGFVGAVPEAQVNEFVDRLVPSEPDEAAGQAREEEEAGDPESAEERYRAMLEEDPANRTARLGLGRMLAARSLLEEAGEMVSPLLPDDEAERILASVRVSSWTSLDQTSALSSAKRLAADGRWREALDGMLAVVGADPDAREAMLDVFAVLGEDDPLAGEYRRKLASALF